MRANGAPSCALILGAVLAGCVASPVRRAQPPTPVQPPVQLQFELRNELGARWRVPYVQVYADGWLLWQGELAPRTTSLGPFTLAGAGAQEIHVRAIASRSDSRGGRLESDRRVFVFRAGRQRLFIRFAPAGLDGSGLRVRLEGR
jgi:hypothetical protein